MSAGTSSEVLLSPGTVAPARLLPPLSKSDVQRALVLQYILERPGWVRLSQPESEWPSDVQAMAQGLSLLRGAGLVGVDIDCRDGGAPFRLLLGQAAVTLGAAVRFWGTPRLAERPHGPLLESLREALGASGLRIQEGAPWPLEVHSPKAAPAHGRFRVDGSESSQFVTSLLLAAASLFRREGRPWRVELLGQTASWGYLELTLQWMKKAGFIVRASKGELVVEGFERPSDDAAVPGDFSSIGYLLLAAWRSGGTVAEVDLDAYHPDKAFVRILAEAGVSLLAKGQREYAVVGALRQGLTASGEECPDSLPTVAAAACLAPAPSRLTGVDILKGKESDRLSGIADMVAAFGGQARPEAGGVLEIAPPAQFPAQARFDSRGDHRLAMSAAMLSLLSGTPLLLRRPECVAKSFPHFWRELGKVGLKVDAK